MRTSANPGTTATPSDGSINVPRIKQKSDGRATTSEGGGKGLIGRGNSGHRKLYRVHSMLIHKVHDVPTRKGTTITCQLPPAPCFERTEMSGGDGGARQCALVGNSLNDQQRSEDLTNPSSH